MIRRAGTVGSYTYSVIGTGSENKPINWVSWFSAARFANWLSNGADLSANTETGSYTLGPYINTTLIPQNPVTGSRVVRVTTLGTLQPSTGSDNGGWLFDSISGRLIADHADYEDL